MSSFINNCHDVSNLYKFLQDIDPEGLFWSVKPLLTYNKPIMVVTSSRSIGKSTNIAAFLLLDYLKNGYNFIYLRRTRDEMLETCKDYFSNAVRLINEHTVYNIVKVEYKAGDYFIYLEGSERPLHCGYAMGLSLEHKYKSKPFDNVGTILYDEFLPKDKSKYLGNLEKDPDKEPRLFNSLYGSVDRELGTAFKNSTRVILSGNTETIYNPFFISWSIAEYLFKDSKAKIINPKDKPWVLQRVDKVKATENFKESLLYAISTEKDKEYNFNNGTGNDFDNAWIETPPKRSIHMLFIKLDNRVYQVQRCRSEFYIVKFSGQPYDRVISLDFSSFAKQDFAMVRRWASNIELLLVHEAFLRGNLFFDSIPTKNTFTAYLNLI